VRLRPLRQDDAGALAAYFRALSDRTRAMYAPHPFDAATAETICRAAGRDGTVRVLAGSGEAPEETIVGYFLLLLGAGPDDRARYAGRGVHLDGGRTASLAPSVADAYQGRGVGSALMRYTLAAAQALGRDEVILMGGVRADNARAIAFYAKHGFRRVGSFVTTCDNHDMMRTLAGHVGRR